MVPIPVYLITGFLESGKTSFIEQVILEGNFVEDEKTLLILTEEGEVEIEDELLDQYNVDLIVIEDKSEFTEDFLKKYGTQKRTPFLLAILFTWSFVSLSQVSTFLYFNF